MDDDLRSVQEVRDLLTKATAAQSRLQSFSQEEIDRLIDAVAAAAEREAESLAVAAHDETGFGNVPDKTVKNLFAARTIYQFIRPLRTVGVLREDPARGLVEIACPKGVVAAIIPSTNPTSTAIYKILIALKAGCGIVLSPHPAASRCVERAAAICAEAAIAAGAPQGIVGCLARGTKEATDELMRHRLTSVILATGGLGLVRAAYSAGKPAYGVGPGNVPAFIERTADVAKAVADIIAGTTFDFGTICSSEQAIVVDRPVVDITLQELRRQKAYILTPAEVAKLGPVVITPDRRVSPRVVGRPAATIARLAGIEVAGDTSVLVARLTEVGPHEPLSLEKLSPVLAMYEVDGWQGGCERCVEILRNGGLGHTMSIHSQDDHIIRRFGAEKPVFRIVVNSPSTMGAIGLTTGVDPSMTLGCGALGGNVTSDNITPLHLIDVKRLAYEVRPHDPGGDVPGWPVGQRKLAAPPRLRLADPAPAAVAMESTTSSGAAISSGHERARELVARFVANRSGASSPPKAMAPVSLGTTREPSAAAPPSAAAAKVVVQPEEKVPVASPPPPRPPGPMIDPAESRVAVDFVCEEDVRNALRDHRQILIGPRTIVTPSARDLAQPHAVLRRIG